MSSCGPGGNGLELPGYRLDQTMYISPSLACRGRDMTFIRYQSFTIIYVAVIVNVGPKNIHGVLFLRQYMYQRPTVKAREKRYRAKKGNI